MASTSRWFVGSSSSSKFGFRMLIIANTILDFWPSDKHPIFVFCIFVSKPNRSSHPRQYSSVRLNVGEFGYVDLKKAKTVFSGSSCSALCWLYRPIKSAVCGFTSPSVAVSSPAMSFRSVDFPQPLGPTSAMRESQSTPMSSSWYRYSSFFPLYENDTLSNGSTGDGSLSHSGNSNTNVFVRSDGFSTASDLIFDRTLSLDAADFALPLAWFAST
mmetsp:Transcript_14113/g.50681  ORF Transcript_14113/g.50681 Transcript_14113/m.50681 type:complete len:215 (-) Transcript_14113:291-935(-)